MPLDHALGFDPVLAAKQLAVQIDLQLQQKVIAIELQAFTDPLERRVIQRSQGLAQIAGIAIAPAGRALTRRVSSERDTSPSYSASSSGSISRLKALAFRRQPEVSARAHSCG